MSAINSPAKKEIGPWMFFMAPLGPLQDREEFISFIRRSSNKTRLKNEQRMCWYECMQIFQCVTAPIPLFQTPQKIGLLKRMVVLEEEIFYLFFGS